MFHPTGTNMVANTGVVAIGMALAPVSWVFGPIATLNVASTLAPVLSALAMFVLLRRWVAWKPAAFVGGLLYGFSPFVLVSLTVSHLMLAMAFVPPLVVGCLDELLLRHERRAVPVGMVLGLLVAVQFFIGTEVLLIMATLTTLGVAGLAAVGTLRPRRLRFHARRAAAGLVAGGATAAVLLAYPVWFALDGPAHLPGVIWPTGLSHQGGTLSALVLPTPSTHGWLVWTRVVGQFQGPLLSDQYIGVGVLAVVALGCLVWRHDRRLWFFGAVAIVSCALDLGVRKGEVLPWQLFARLPLFEDVVPGRFVLPALLALAVMLAIVLDHAYASLGGRARRPVICAFPGWHDAGGGIPLRPPLAGDGGGARPSPQRRRAGGLVPAGDHARDHPSGPGTPLVRDRRPQRARRPGAAGLARCRRCVESPLTWQAVDRMHYVAATGSGPADDLSRAGRLVRAESVLYNASTALHRQSFVPGDTGAVRRRPRRVGGDGRGHPGPARPSHLRAGDVGSLRRRPRRRHHRPGSGAPVIGMGLVRPGP